ncbi:serine/threonine-protein kinase [Microbacterium azadirachtae]|uniref:non-specific serine/threonine protein kinase n=1 Tax=Microbacterium azadirachtae TaxID=582680 RepID=A0A0F0LK42_9MICO|nr:serine/threonine-protein kinase [Microbacterium azadirachtae]KJL33572.1 Serine/threonine-protein kinase PknK [Microbacterium azadirachtae]
MSRPPSPPPQLDGFDYVEPLGTGGFADVFLYEQQQPRRRVAVKVLLADRLASGAAQEFADEANVMAMLSTHPAIVTIYQTGVAADGRPYLVMEYCPRPNLQQRARKEPFSVAEALRVGVQVAGAVETAHRAGVLHRDIKPANILVTAYNRPALTDFGIASTTGAVSEAAGMSIPWSPPESFGDPPQGGVRSDVYALAATLYTLLTGRSPFEKPGQRNSGADLIARIESEPLPPLGRADVPESLSRLLERGMAKNPDDRFGSAVAFARALQKIQIELSHSVTPIDIVDDHQPEPDHDDDDDGLTRVREVVSIDPGHTATRPSATTSPMPPQAGAHAPGPRFDAALPPVPAEDPSLMDETVIRVPQDVTAAAAPAVGAPVPAPAPEQGDDDPTMLRAPRTVSPIAGVPVAKDAGPALVPGIPGVVAETSAEAPTARGSRKGLLWGLIAAVVAVVLIGGSIVTVNLLNANRALPKPSPSTKVNPVDPLGDMAAAPKDVVGAPDGAGGVHFTWSNPKPQDRDSYLVTVITLAGDGETTKVDKTEITIPAQSGQTCIDVVLRRENGSGSAPVRGCTTP